MFGALRPGHLADMDESLNPLLQFYECTVVGHTDHASTNVRADGITVLGIEPGIRRELLEA